MTALERTLAVRYCIRQDIVMVNQDSTRAVDPPARTFVDDFGRQWEWCGGTEGTWAWRITRMPSQLLKARP